MHVLSCQLLIETRGRGPLDNYPSRALPPLLLPSPLPFPHFHYPPSPYPSFLPSPSFAPYSQPFPSPFLPPSLPLIMARCLGERWSSTAGPGLGGARLPNAFYAIHSPKSTNLLKFHVMLELIGIFGQQCFCQLMQRIFQCGYIQMQVLHLNRSYRLLQMFHFFVSLCIIINII